MPKGGRRFIAPIISKKTGSQVTNSVYDTTAPTAPGTPTISSITSSGTATLTFTASTDAVGVTGYAAFLDGALTPAATSATNSINLTNVPVGAHTVTIKAFDAAGNFSSASNAVNFTIPKFLDINSLINNSVNDALNNTLALQSAINTAKNGVIEIPSGKWYVNGALIIPSKTKIVIPAGTELIAVAPTAGAEPFNFFTNSAYSNPKYVGVTFTSVAYGQRGVRVTATFPVSMAAILSPGDWILVDQDVSEIYLGAHQVETVSGNNVTFLMYLGGGYVGSIAANGAAASGSYTIPVASTNSLVIGQTVMPGTFTGIPPGTSIVSFVYNTSITLSNAITANVSAGQTVVIKDSLSSHTWANFTNSATQSNSGQAIVNLISTAGIAPGCPVYSGGAIPANTYVIAVTSNTVTLNNNLTANITSGNPITVYLLSTVVGSAVKCDIDIEVSGSGILNGNFESGGFVHATETSGAAGTLTGIHSINFNNVIYSRVGRNGNGSSLKFRQTIGYAVCMANAYFPKIDGVHGEGCERDGVHLYGPCWYPEIENLTGSFSDDGAIFQPTDGPGYASVQTGTLQTIGIGGVVVNQGVSGGVTLGGNFYQGGKMRNILSIGDGNTGQACLYPLSDPSTGNLGLKMFGKYTIENVGNGYPNTTGGVTSSASVSIGGGLLSPNNYIDEVDLINVKGSIAVLGSAGAIINVRQLSIDGYRVDSVGENPQISFDYTNIKRISSKKLNIFNVNANPVFNFKSSNVTIGSIDIEGTIDGGATGSAYAIKSNGATVKTINYGKIKLLNNAQATDNVSTFANTPTVIIDGVDATDTGTIFFGLSTVNQAYRVIVKSFVSAGTALFNLYLGYSSRNVAISVGDVETSGNALFFNGTANGTIRNIVNYLPIQTAAPAAAGTVALKDQWGYQIWNLSPTGAFTIAANAHPIDGEIMELNFISGGYVVTLSGLTIQGFPGTPAAGYSGKWRYNAANTTWLKY